MIDLIYRKFGNRLQAKDDLLSGLTVALALVPEAIAFAIIAGVPPLVGLYAAFLVCLITAIAGGRPGMISGATGALAVIMVGLVKIGNEKGQELGLGEEAGLQYLFVAVILMGIIQITCGAFRLGRFVRLIPQPVMFGFVNGLAIVIFMAQFPMFTDAPTESDAPWLQGGSLFLMLGLVFVTMAISFFLPKFTTAVPASLVGIIVVSLIVIGFGLNTLVVGDMSSVEGSFPMPVSFTIPLNLDTFIFIAPFSFILAAVGLIESLLTLTLIDELTETRGSSNRECVGQGIANIVTGFFGGMGGCAMIGQSIINIRSGGRGRLSGIAAGLFLICFILFASALIERIPLAALTGVMFMVVIGTFEWSSIRILKKIPKSDAFVILLVSIVTVVTHNLALAVILGVIVSALVFAWKSAHHVHRETEIREDGSKVYYIHGPLFFGSIQDFNNEFSPSEDPDVVVVDMMDSRVWDHSGLEAIQKLAARYRANGKTLKLQHISRNCQQLLETAGSMVDVIVLDDDPIYIVANLKKENRTPSAGARDGVGD
ncbi:SulP family inorganic anion transporter [Verrucomicrobiales bacterium]|nr:SulP family inorganic anion transporter [Verrucomicrobiales bacterium]MDA9923350.1 SulP family inorganic anion transporter [Verrucomicrobiales bacterium]